MAQKPHPGVSRYETKTAGAQPWRVTYDLLTVDELLVLARVLRRSPADSLDAAGVDARLTEDLTSYPPPLAVDEERALVGGKALYIPDTATVAPAAQQSPTIEFNVTTSGAAQTCSNVRTACSAVTESEETS